MSRQFHILTFGMLLLGSMMLHAQSFTLSGVVSDEEGNAIELATVSCLEQGAVTVANLKGEYSLNLVGRLSGGEVLHGRFPDTYTSAPQP